MSYQAVQHVLEHSPSRLAARLVELVLASHADSEGHGAWPSVATIAREARLSERAVRDALSSLRSSGLIVATGESRRRTRVYSVGPAVYGPSAPAGGAGLQSVQGADGAGGEARTGPAVPADGAGVGVQTAQAQGADGAPKPPENHPSSSPEPPAPAARATADLRVVDGVMPALVACAERRGLPAPNRQRVADAVAASPAVDVVRVASELDRGWRGDMDDVVGAFRHRLRAVASASPGRSLIAEPPAELVASWPAVLERMRDAVGAEQYSLWRVDDLRVAGVDEDTVVVAAPREYASMASRFDRALRSALDGRPVRITSAMGAPA